MKVSITHANSVLYLTASIGASENRKSNEILIPGVLTPADSASGHTSTIGNTAETKSRRKKIFANFAYPIVVPENGIELLESPSRSMNNWPAFKPAGKLVRYRRSDRPCVDRRNAAALSSQKKAPAQIPRTPRAFRGRDSCTFAHSKLGGCGRTLPVEAVEIKRQPLVDSLRNRRPQPAWDYPALHNS
jgi:hypothetical protein